MKNEEPNELLERMIESCPFENDNELADYLSDSLKKYSLIDLLEKLVCLRFFMQTDRLVCDETKRLYLKQLFNDSFCFLLPFLLCYKIDDGIKKIRFDDLYFICQNIDKYLMISKFKDTGSFYGKYNDKIDYIQNNITDLIGPFKRVPVGDVLSCENELIKEKYNVSTDNIVDELIDVFLNKIYVLSKWEKVEIDEFINNFDIYINSSNFVVSKEHKTYKLCDDLSIEFGSLDKKFFSFKNPLSTINLSRKIFIKHDGIIYNLCDDLICGRLNRSIESLFTTNIEKDEWRQNYKEKTEGLIKDVMETYLPGGEYYENNYYKDSSGNICENDGIYDYHGLLFCIEIKGNKFNPDSIRDNAEKVEKSYEEVIGKAKSQVLRLKEKLRGQTSFSILNSDGSVKCSINEIVNKKIIGICVYFEDIGTLLAGLPVDESNVLHISFYDLLLVFNFLDNPFLICKYLYERSLPINDKRYYINDELLFLSLFRTCIHLNDFINSQNIPDLESGNVGTIFLSNEDFGMEIEMYFVTGMNKPTIKMNSLIRRMITLHDYSVLDDNLFNGVSFLLEKSENSLFELENKYKDKNRGNVRLPLSIVFTDNKGQSFALMFISRGHNPYQKKQNLAYAKRYFAHRENVDVIYLLEIGKDYTEAKKLVKDSMILKDIDEDSLLSDISFNIVQNANLE